MGITDQLLAAYVDGELSPDLAALILSRLEAEPDLLDRMEQHQQLRQELSSLYAPVMSEPIPSDLASLVIKEGSAARWGEPASTALGRLRDGWPIWAAAAAGLIGGIGLSEVRHMGDPITHSRDGKVVASGPLAKALENDLAAAGGASGVKIMASFQDRAGRFCRVFQRSGREDGVACKDGDRWEVAALATSAATASSQDYRQASSTLAPSVAAAVDELQGAVALTADQERQARTRQWRGRGKAAAKSN